MRHTVHIARHGGFCCFYVACGVPLWRRTFNRSDEPSIAGANGYSPNVSIHKPRHNKAKGIILPHASLHYVTTPSLI